MRTGEPALTAPIPLERAQGAIAAAMAEAKKHNWPSSVAVVDSGNNLVAFGRYPLSGRPSLDGQVFALFLIAVAAAEAALGLALVVLLYRHRGTLDANAWMSLKDE